MAKTSFYSGSGADSNDVSALENLKNQAQTSATAAASSATAAASSASSAAASVASLNEDVATQSTKGLMSAADKTKLDGVESGATADQTAAEIKTAYESNSDTNAFTDAEQTKLSGIESSADVTDATNVQAAGALMDSEVTSLSGIKTLTVPDSTTVSTFGASLVDDADAAAARTTLGLGTAATTASTAYATAAQGSTADAALPKAGGTMTGAITFASGQTFDGRDVSVDGTKLDTVETSADVTDATNVQAAGALMDSELTSEASVKAMDQGVATTDSPTFAGLSTTADITFGDNDKAIFGAGSDLQIYHDAAVGHSIIKDDGTGNLNLLADNFRIANAAWDKWYFTADNGGAATLFYNGAGKLATTSTGIDVTGTVVTDALRVETSQGNISITNSASSLNFARAGSNYIRATDTSGDFNFITGANDFATFRLKLANNGDISFYEDTGTTAKFFWDASAERLGIGTSSPERPLHISANPPIILLEDTGGGTDDKRGQINVDTGLFQISARNDDNSNRTDILTADLGTGNVGIGTTSPAAKLDVRSTGGTYTGGLLLQSVTAGNFGTIFTDSSNMYLGTAGAHIFASYDGSSERLRIDTSGNVGIGTTSPSTELHVAASSGYAELRLQGASGSSGSLEFYDSTTKRGDIYIDTSSNILFRNTSEAMRLDNSGNLLCGSDGGGDIGSSTKRFKDLYLSGGVYLGGTGAANKLDDYEEGTWTPVLGGTSTVSGQTYAIQEGWYRKVGSLVVASFLCDLTTAGTISGNAAILGLPFTSQSSNSNHRGHISSVAFDSLGVSPNFISSTVLSNTTQARIGWNTSESASLSFSLTGSSIFVNGSSFQGTITYYTA